jgi:hypothetical protein
LATSRVASSVTMKPIRFEYDDARLGVRQETHDSVDEILPRLRAICAEFSLRVNMPFGVDLVATNGDRMSVALGSDTAVVSRFRDETAETVTAVGDPSAVGRTLFYFGDHTLIPNKFVIPLDLALQIVLEWCELGTLSSMTQWTSEIR